MTTEKRWISASEFTSLQANGVKVCSYVLSPVWDRPTALFCGRIVVGDGTRCKECPIARSRMPLNSPTPRVVRTQAGQQIQHWLTFEQFLEESKQHRPICSYLPNRGLNKDHVCGALATNTLTEPNNLMWRCSWCQGKRGDIQSKMIGPAPVPAFTLSDIKITTPPVEQTTGDLPIAETVPSEELDPLVESSLAWLKQVFPDEDTLKYFLKVAATLLDTAK
jgi:hypothetical protein